MGRLIMLFLNGALVAVLILDLLMIAFTIQVLQFVNRTTPSPIENQRIEYYESCTDVEESIFLPTPDAKIVSYK